MKCQNDLNFNSHHLKVSNNSIAFIQVDACGEGYDFTSVMHYSLKSFAIDYDQNTVTPKDASITAAGNTELSAWDIKKLQCM